jgi:hypothetical protein
VAGWLDPWSQVLFDKPTVVPLLYNFPKLHGTQRFITVFTRACHWSLSWTTWIQSIPPNPISLGYILILFSHQCVGNSYSLFRSDFPTHLVLLDLITLLIFSEECKLLCSLCNFPQPPIISPILGSIILLSIVFRHHCLCSSLSVRDQGLYNRYSELCLNSCAREMIAKQNNKNLNLHVLKV